MKKTLANQFGSAILDAFVTKNIEGKHLEKTKVLSNSKSAKNLPVSRIIETAFKKGNKKIQLQAEQKEKKEKHSANKQQITNVKPANNFNKPDKKPNNEFNKFSNNKSIKVAHNLEQFLTRNQQFQKQKQLKLQFQRRKQLYGVSSDLKFKPSLIIKQNQEAEFEPNAENQQQSKSYKLMYQKKYGKFRIQEDYGKKKVKKYQELMKQSILRFQQKFKEIGGSHPESIKMQNNMLDNYQQRSEQMMINISNKYQASTTLNSKAVKLNVEDIDKKIKVLMQKLKIQYQFNDSIESISELSRIQLRSDIKESQMNSSNLFNKVDNQIILKEQFMGMQEGKQLQDYSLVHIGQYKNEEDANNNHYSLQFIEQPQQNKQKQHASTKIRTMYQQNQQNESDKQQSHDIKQKLALPQELQQNKSQQGLIVKNQAGFKIQKSNHKAQQLKIVPQRNINANINDIQHDKNEEMKEQAITSIEDLCQTSLKLDQIPSFSFKQIYYPQVYYKIVRNQATSTPEQPSINIKKANTSENTQIGHSKDFHFEDSLKHKEGRRPQSIQPQQQLDKQLSYQDQHETHIESFIDLHGNFIQDVQVEVLHFGYCRFLAIQEQSQRRSHDSQS